MSLARTQIEEILVIRSKMLLPRAQNLSADWWCSNLFLMVTNHVSLNTLNTLNIPCLGFFICKKEMIETSTSYNYYEC